MHYIKEWFLNKNFDGNERYVINLAMIGGELYEVRQTEKAIQFRAESDFGNFTFWCPKSCIESEEEVEKRRQKQTARFESGLSYNATLVAFAKKNGIKGVRSGLKTATLIKKIVEAGFEVPARG